MDFSPSRLASGKLLRSAGFLLLLTLAGCESAGLGNFFGEKEPPPEPEKPAALLYNQGLAALREGRTRDAKDRFEEVDRQHPYTEDARKAQIMLAFVAYRRGQYDDSISAAKRYLSLYPGTPDAAYAQYIIGQSYYNTMPVVTRDQEATKRAIAAMQEIINNYPKSVYADDAREKILIARDQLAGKEMQIGRYYLERREYTAAINRFRTVITDFGNTRHVEEALYRLTEANLAMGLSPEAQNAAAVLGHNFPDSQWYKDAFNLLQKGGLQPQEAKDSWISRALKTVRGA